MSNEFSPAEGESPGAPQPGRPRLRLRWVAVLLVGAGVLYLLLAKDRPAGADNSKSGTGAEKKQKRGQGPAPIPVVAARARRGNIGVYFTGLGAVTPINTVMVRSRVDGELVQVAYREGDLVQKGDLLVQIDPRPYQAQLNQVLGQLMRDQAALENARLDLTRYQTLLTQKAIPEQQVATQKATVAQDEGTVRTDQAQVDNARLNLNYCRITAPITGRVGLRLVDAGNIVHASDTNGLVVITQITPISAIFTIAEDQLPQVLQRMRAGGKLRADAYDRDMKTRIAQGTLTTVDNQIDQTTGTVRLRATFENQDGRLFPNEFVNIRLLIEEKRNVVLLNSAAVQRSTNQTYVYLVQPDNTVAVRQISLGVTEGDDYEITSGLAEGDAVVMTGVDKLQQGTAVNVQMENENKGGARGKRR